MNDLYSDLFLLLILKDTSSTIEDVHDGYITKDGKLVLDFLQAIHAAEQRQAEMDTRTFTEEMRAMKVRRQPHTQTLVN